MKCLAGNQYRWLISGSLVILEVRVDPVGQQGIRTQLLDGKALFCFENYPPRYLSGRKVSFTANAGRCKSRPQYAQPSLRYQMRSLD